MKYKPATVRDHIKVVTCGQIDVVPRNAVDASTVMLAVPFASRSMRAEKFNGVEVFGNRD